MEVGVRKRCGFRDLFFLPFTTFAESSDVFGWGNGVEKGNWAEGGFTPWQSLCFFFFFLLLFLPMMWCTMCETQKLSLDNTPAQLFSCSVDAFSCLRERRFLTSSL